MVAPLTHASATSRDAHAITQGNATEHFAQQASRQSVRTHDSEPDTCTPAVTAADATIAQHREASGNMRQGALLSVLHTLQHAQDKLGCAMNEQTPDGKVTAVQRVRVNQPSSWQRTWSRFSDAQIQLLRERSREQDVI